MRDALRFTITDAGRAAVPQPPATLHAACTHLAVGRGNITSPPENGGYQPTGAETALKNEFLRVPFSAGSKPAPDQISFAALVEGDATGWINEVGVFLQDGTLFALWSEDPAVVQRTVDGVPVYGSSLGFRALGIGWAIATLLTVSDFSIDNLDIIVNGPPINLTVNFYDAPILNLLAVVTDRARALRDLEAARRQDETLISNLRRRMDTLDARVALLEGDGT